MTCKPDRDRFVRDVRGRSDHHPTKVGKYSRMRYLTRNVIDIDTNVDGADHRASETEKKEVVDRPRTKRVTAPLYKQTNKTYK